MQQAGRRVDRHARRRGQQPEGHRLPFRVVRHHLIAKRRADGRRLRWHADEGRRGVGNGVCDDTGHEIKPSIGRSRDRNRTARRAFPCLQHAVSGQCARQVDQEAAIVGLAGRALRNAGEAAKRVDRQQGRQGDRPVSLVGDRNLVGNGARRTVQPRILEQDVDKRGNILERGKSGLIIDAHALAIGRCQRCADGQYIIARRDVADVQIRGPAGRIISDGADLLNAQSGVVERVIFRIGH